MLLVTHIDRKYLISKDADGYQYTPIRFEETDSRKPKLQLNRATHKLITK
jgi:hypothetical protein